MMNMQEIHSFSSGKPKRKTLGSGATPQMSKFCDATDQPDATYSTGNIEDVEDFLSWVSSVLEKQEIATNQEMSYYPEMAPTEASIYTLPNWSDEILPKGDKDHGMIHIIQNHTKKGRVENLLSNDWGKDIVTKNSNIDEKTYKTLKTSILRKIKRSSGTSFNPNDFDRKEMEIIDIIMIKVNKKNLYPYSMSEQQIKATIRTAYEHAKKAGGIQKPGIGDRINCFGNKKHKPRKVYRGEAK